MHNLVGWLLQTDPNRRPSIEQVLTHPAIITKVKEFQILHPCPIPQRSKKRFGQPKAAPVLPVNEKKTGQKIKIDMRPGAKKIIRKKSVSTSDVGKKEKKFEKQEKRVSTRASIRNMENKQKSENNEMKVSIGDIEKLKKKAKEKQLQGTPRPNRLITVNESVNNNNYSENRKMFKKKDETPDQTHTIQSQIKDDKKVDINQSINSRKERINQLLSRYGKNKEGIILYD